MLWCRWCGLFLWKIIFVKNNNWFGTEFAILMSGSDWDVKFQGDLFIGGKIGENWMEIAIFVS